MNRDIVRERTALFLYVVLLVLPAVVLGALLTHRLWRDHQIELAAVPYRCQDAVDRLATNIAYRIESRLNAENARPFFHYQDEFLDPETNGVAAQTTSPLRSEPRPTGVLGWYAYDSYASSGVERAQLYFGADPALSEAELRRIVERELTQDELERRTLFEYQVQEDIEVEREVHLYTYRVLGVNLHRGSNDECYEIAREASAYSELGTVIVTPLTLRFLKDAAGEQRLVAERFVYVPGEAIPSTAPQCLQHLSQLQSLYQGVVLDPVWLFDELPNQVAREVLDPSQALVPESRASTFDPEDVIVCEANMFDGLPYALESDEGMGRLYVATDRTAMRQRFRAQILWLGSVGLVLALSMAVGLRLLVGRLRASREEAQRTRNFVAAVTHELRTPVAAVKLYGEMLADGWIRDEAQRQDYVARIVRETDRLSTLIDRVLLRRKLQDQPPTPRAGDLNAEVLTQRPGLELVNGAPARDLAFELAPDLPHVLLVPDGVHVVLTNLVENARKYAPVDVDDPTAEPILVRTRRDARGAVLEVLDRGAGVPESDRKRVFDAFYRPGDERTRATPGTGLGLHLVALQARAMRGKVEVLPRSGGGSIFRLSLRR
ncbi:MAG: HAMP domain-containing sensor histidine kinase [Planctomycetota bacterium]